MLRAIFKFLSSLKLALLLLSVIIIASAYGTYLESFYHADIAKKIVYNHWWFDIWLGLLCINLFSVAAIRYPWKSHQTGFVITHAGIIILLIGGWIDRQWGIEGFLELRRGEPPTRTMQLHDQRLLVAFNPGSSPVGEGEPGTAVTPLKLTEMISPSSFDIPVKTPSPDIQVKVVDVYPPAVHVTLQGPMMGRHPMALFLDDEQNMGPATLLFKRGIPPEPPASKSQESDDNPDLQVSLFGHEYKLAVRENIKKSFKLEGLSEPWSLRIIGYYPDFRIDGKNLTNASDKPNNPAVSFELTGPEVKGEDGKMTPRMERGFIFYFHDPMVLTLAGEKTGAALKIVYPNGGPDTAGGMAPGANALTFYLGEDGKLRYYIKSRKHGDSVGGVAMEKPVPVSWAPGAEFIVHEVLPEGITLRALDRSAPPELQDLLKKSDNRVPGLLCKVSVGNESKSVWVPQSLHPEHPYKEKVILGGKEIDLALASAFVKLPFHVALEKFSAPLDEGVDGSFMEFASTLSFDNQEDTVRLKKDSKLAGTEHALPRDPAVLEGAITGIGDTALTMDFPDRTTLTIPLDQIEEYNRRTHNIHMNSPTTYPAVWWGPWTGLNYKFSQANHHMPQDPDYSGVQVLRDPGWMPKWVGCLMICFGIFTMFYLKPYFSGRREAALTKADAAAADAVKTEGKLSRKQRKTAETVKS